MACVMGNGSLASGEKKGVAAHERNGELAIFPVERQRDE